MVTSVEKEETGAKLKPGWRMVRFGDVVRNIQVNVNPEESGLDRYVAGEHMETDNLHIKRWGTIGDGYLGPAFHQKFVNGQVLYGSRRTYLRKIAVADFDGICANTTFVLEANEDELLQDLLPFIMQTEAFTQHSIKQSRGSVNPYVIWKDLAWYEFALPPKDEQRRIADILWEADEAILALQRVEEKANKVLNTIREEIICSSLHKRQKLADCLIKIVPGRSVLGTNKAASPDKFGVLKVSAVSSYGFVADENKQLLNPDDFRSEFQVRAGDFLITRCNTRELVGRVCIVPRDFNNLMLCDKTLRLDLDENKVSKVFLLEALRSKEIRTQIEAAASGTGGAMKNISQTDIYELQVPLPSLERQQSIVSLIRNMTQAQHSIEAHIRQNMLLRKTLLQQLLAL